MWQKMLAGKQALYYAMSEFHRSEHDSNEKMNIGEAIARLMVKKGQNFFNYFLNLNIFFFNEKEST